MRVDIETCSHLSAGQTVADIWHQSGKSRNVYVCMDIDMDRFWAIMIDAIHSADRVSPANIVNS